ncbi:MAG TPA: AMP-binding protein [Thermomicrobiaceae bacterium]|nr:AMP-binding protein [Thermomicrobiaceae bacterium]
MEFPVLHQALERWAAARPEKTFLREVEGGRTLSFAECLAAVNGLRRQLGGEPRTIVLALPGGVAASVVWLAALCGGHRLIPCSPEITIDEAEALAARYHPDLLVAETPEVTRRLERVAPHSLTRSELEASVDGWTQAPQPAPGDWRGGELCLTTSGTTGTPKGISLRAEQLAWTAEQIRRSHRLDDADRGLAVLPFFHINAPVVSLCSTLLAGAELVIAPRFSRSRFWAWIEDERITWASIVPTIVAVLLQTERPPWLPGTLRFVRTASAPLPAMQLRAFERRFGIPVIETYGLSEAASTVTANPVPPGRHKPGSVGKPLGVTLRVCRPRAADDSAGDELYDVPAGTEGEVCISGANVIAAYDGGASAAAFQGGWFRTGDLGYLDEDGYLFISGRLKDVINRGGEKIAPREVEELLLTHPAVLDAAVVARPDPIYGELPVAYVMLAPHARGTSTTPLSAFCAQRLSPYKVPAEIVAVDSLPRTRTGKIQRHVLRAAPELTAPTPAARYGVA